MKFCEDIEAVLTWVDVPVIFDGHSAGAVGAIIAAERNPDKIKLLFWKRAMQTPGKRY